jgi:hypothetical protein
LQRMPLNGTFDRPVHMGWMAPFSGRVSDAGLARSGGPGKRAGVRKPPKKEPAGKRQDLAVYGDLARRRVCRGMIFLGSLRAESR